jgi:hypothetical protein
MRKTLVRATRSIRAKNDTITPAQVPGQFLQVLDKESVTCVMGRRSLALNDPKVVESNGKKIIKDLEKIIRVSKVPALTLFDLEKIRAQKEWKGSKVHANGL